MALKVSLEGAVYFTKLSVSLAYCWPPASTSSKWEKRKFDVLWCTSLIIAMGLFVPLLYSCYEYKSDSLILTKTACFLGAVSGYIIKIFVCRIHRKRIHALIYEMEEYMKIAQIHERAVLQRYVDRCSFLHGSITLLNYLTTAFVICRPLFSPDDEIFAIPAVYPFPISYGPMLYLVYAHQSFVGFQCSVGATIDCQAALLMWYIGARMEIFVAELEKINDTTDLYNFIQKHQKLLGLADEAKHTMSYIALTTTTMSGIVTIASCLQLVSNQPIAVKMHFGPIALISVAHLSVSAWPADNLMKMCGFVATAAYNTSWFTMPPAIRRNILMIIRRSQRPVIASIGGFLPALSLRYYASFLAAAYSYFTTLRVTVNVNDR